MIVRGERKQLQAVMRLSLANLRRLLPVYNEKPCSPIRTAELDGHDPPEDRVLPRDAVHLAHGIDAPFSVPSVRHEKFRSRVLADPGGTCENLAWCIASLQGSEFLRVK